MSNIKYLLFLSSYLLIFSACSTTSEVSKANDPIVQRAYLETELIGPKKKIAVSEFTNSTPYGQRRLGQNISSILITELSNTNRFIVLERDHVSKIMDEIKLSMSGLSEDIYQDFELLGADYLIVGDVTKFAVSTEGNRSLASRSRTQKADVSADLRIINVRTGEVILSETGSGLATKTTREVLGMGSSAGYDEGLEQDAFRASVTSVMENIVKTISSREWICDIIEIEGENIYVNAGRQSNLEIGTTLSLYEQGDPLKDNSGRILGYREIYLGTATVISHLGEDVSILNTDLDINNSETSIIAKFK
jgi:curli biogenesis system outer membrane secretion channel CsgG